MTTASKVLDKLHEWYAATDNGPNAGALLFEDDRTLREHIAEAIGAELPDQSSGGYCTCDQRSWYGDEHDSACELEGERGT